MNIMIVLGVFWIVLLVVIPFLIRAERRSKDLKWSVLELLSESSNDWTEARLLSEIQRRSQLFVNLRRSRLYNALHSLERNGYIVSYRKPLSHPAREDRFYRLPTNNR